MRYTLDPGNDVAAEVRRIARVQADEAIRDLEDPGDDVVDAVHDCRKRCKKLRGLVRLVRPALGDQYQPANRTFRDAARALSDLRDAHALLGTFEDLLEAHEDQLSMQGLDPVRDELRARSEAASSRADDAGDEMAAALDLLERGVAMIDEWDLDEDDFDAIAGGLAKTYGRARKALARAVVRPTTERLHEYRKRTKYGWYHARLLDATAPSVLEPYADRLHDLSDALGDDHDLAVLRQQLDGDADADVFGGDGPVGTALVMIDGQRADLQRRAMRLGARVHAESAGAFVDRHEAYWEAWHVHGPELPAGEISVVGHRVAAHG